MPIWSSTSLQQEIGDKWLNACFCAPRKSGAIAQQLFSSFAARSCRRADRTRCTWRHEERQVHTCTTCKLNGVQYILKPRLPLTADKGWHTEQFRKDHAVQQVLTRSIRNVAVWTLSSNLTMTTMIVQYPRKSICDENGSDVVSSCEIPSPQSGCGDPWLKIDEHGLSILKPYSVVLVKNRAQDYLVQPNIPCKHLCRFSNKLG